jgi:hypothetical protein
MGKLVNNRFLVLLLSAGYLFVSLTHISFIQRYRPFKADVASPVSIFKQQSVISAIGSLKIFVKRTDKNRHRQYEVIGQLITSLSGLFLFLFFTLSQEVTVRPTVAILDDNRFYPSVLCCFRL